MTPGLNIPVPNQGGVPLRLDNWRGIQCLAIRALEGGGRHSRLTEIEWSISGRCERPVTIAATGRKDDRRGVGKRLVFREGEIRKRGQTVYVGPVMLGSAPMGSLAVTMEVPCRRCRACLGRRGWEWRKRALAEVGQAGRTWMGTLTIRPSAYAQFEAQAQLEFSRGVESSPDPRSLDNWATGDGPAPTYRVKRGGSFTDWWKLPETDRIRRIERTVYREISLMLKRIRKQSGVTGIRFICVFERQNSEDEFFLHAHMLLHEPATNGTVRYRDLDKRSDPLGLTPQWGHGWSQWRLLKKSPGYVTKYIAKAACTVHASKHYGSSKEQALSALSDFLSPVQGEPDNPSTVATNPVRDGQDGSRVLEQGCDSQNSTCEKRETVLGVELGGGMPRHPRDPPRGKHRQAGARCRAAPLSQLHLCRL